jgi:hypothetical protein
VYKDSRKRKEEKSAKSKRVSALGETRLAVTKEQRLARLSTYLFSPLKQNGDKHRRDVRKSNLDVGRPHESHAQEVNNMTACHTDNLGRKLIHESIAEKILHCLR